MQNRSALSKAGRPRAQSGNAMLEFALLLPLTMIMFFGTMDFSRVFYAAIELSNAAQAGALYGAQSVTYVSDTVGIQQAAVFEAQDLTGMTAASSHYCQCPWGRR
ncbi:MAG: pilus assembly protein [Acidobacteriota bacterium]|nr:pilus assembly protein [Acidobacteriota bacterium]